MHQDHVLPQMRFIHPGGTNDREEETKTGQRGQGKEGREQRIGVRVIYPQDKELPLLERRQVWPIGNGWFVK